MANIRFFGLLILFFIGAGALSSDALAMTQEGQGMQNVQTWLKTNYIEKGATKVSNTEVLEALEKQVATQMGIFKAKINGVLRAHGCGEANILYNGNKQEEYRVKLEEVAAKAKETKSCGKNNPNGCGNKGECRACVTKNGYGIESTVYECDLDPSAGGPWKKDRSNCPIVSDDGGVVSYTSTTNSGQTLKTYILHDGSKIAIVEGEKSSTILAGAVEGVGNALKTVGDCVDDMLNGEFDRGKCLQAILGNSFSWANFTDEILDPDECPGVTPQERAAVKEEAVRLDHYFGDLGLMEDLKGANGEIWELCTEDSKGRPVCSYILVNTAEGTITSINGVMQGCKPLPFKLYEAKSCLFCPLFKIIYNTIQIASTEAYDLLAIPLARILLIGLAIWIALMVLRNVSSLTEQKAPQFLTQLFANSFKVVIVYFLLANSSIIYNMIIGPLLKAGFDFGLSFLDNAQEYANNCKLTVSSSAKGVLPSYVYAHLKCFIESINFQLATVQAIGSSMMCVSQNAARGNVMMIARLIPDFEMLIEGAIVWATAFIIAIGFSFYLIDAVIQLGIFGMLLPFLLMCYPFKITQKYFSSGVGVFMNSWFIFVFMGLVTNVCIKLIGESLTDGQGGFAAVEAAMNGNDIIVLKKLLDIGSAGIVILIACCVFAIKLMTKVTELAGKFSGGGLNLGIGSKLGGLGASGVVNTAKWGAGKVGDTVKGVAEAKMFGEDGKEWSVMDKVRGARHKAARAVGKGIGGAFHVTGKVLASPVRFTKSLFKGKSRRTPPVP